MGLHHGDTALGVVIRGPLPTTSRPQSTPAPPPAPALPCFSDGFSRFTRTPAPVHHSTHPKQWRIATSSLKNWSSQSEQQMRLPSHSRARRGLG